MNRTITIEVGGRTFRGEVATIESTMLGYEDHGILGLASSTMGQSAGSYFLDDRLSPNHDNGPEPHGSAAGIDYIQRVLRVVGADSWEQLRGMRVIALRTQEFGVIDGLANVDDDRTFVFQDWADEWSALRKKAQVVGA